MDFGLVHLVALDFNTYYGVDPCGDECKQSQLEWLEKDLKTVDRERTPWVALMAHFPIFCTGAVLHYFVG